MGFWDWLQNKEVKLREELKKETCNPICANCTREIQPHDKRKTFGGKKFHLKCLRKLRKQIKKQHF